MRQEVAPDVLQGKKFIALAISEPQAGSDVAGMVHFFFIPTYFFNLLLFIHSFTFLGNNCYEITRRSALYREWK